MLYQFNYFPLSFNHFPPKDRKFITYVLFVTNIGQDQCIILA